MRVAESPVKNFENVQKQIIGNEFNLFKKMKNYIPFSLISRRKQ